MENKCQKALIMATFFSVVIAVTLAINPCTDRVENEICGQAGSMTKRCRKVKPDCVGATCRLICVPETRGNPATIDWCSPNPCLYGGTCVNLPDGYTCHCVLGWSGDNCEVPDCSAGSPLYCNCVDDCPGAIDEAICDCSGSDYSDDFVTIPEAGIYDNTVGMLANTTPALCKAYCLATPACLTAEYHIVTGWCYLNGVSALQAGSEFLGSGATDYEFYSRRCVCN